MASVNAGKGLVFNQAATTSQAVSLNINPSSMVSGSFHVQTDGSADVSVAVQASNVPGLQDGFGPVGVRNDTATSQDYATLSTQTVPAGTGVQNAMVSLPSDPYRSIRLMVKAASGSPMTKVYYCSTGYNS